MRRYILFFVALFFTQDVIGETYTIDTKAEWEKWIIPKQVVKVKNDGRVELVTIRKNINAALDAPQFLYYSDEKKMYFPGEVTAGSNPQAAANLIDGRYDTSWNPDPQDPLERWVVTLNLGRVVAATKVRLIFADTLGMGPFELFAVHISDGAKLFPSSDISRYTLLGKTTLPNRAKVVEYPITYREAQDATRAGESTGRFLNFSQVQYVQVIFMAKTPKAALAEIEVEALGDNIALGTFDRFGNIEAHVSEQDGPKIFDGDAGTLWNFPNVPDNEWDKGPVGGARREPSGAWFEWDLGATFWVSQIFLLFGREGRFGTVISAKPDGYIILTSDGSPRPGGEVDAPGGRFDYVPLVDVWNRDLPYQYQFSHTVDPPRRVRWIFFRHAHGTGVWGRGRVTFYEMQVYGGGFPAEATLLSSLTDVDLINAIQNKIITGVEWDADVPSGAKLEIRSRTGNTLNVEKRFFDKDGKEVPERTYRRLPTNLKGDSLVTTSPGLDWSDWSDFYTLPGGAFLSPNPKQYLQFQVKLISERSDIAPTLRSLSIRSATPLVKGVEGVLQPREVSEVDQPIRYAYGIWPVREAKNPGFDRILIKSEASLEREGVRVEVKKTSVEPTSVNFSGDSLIIQLPQVVREDSVTVRFTARVTKNATIFEAFIGNLTIPGIWQFVDPVGRNTTTVFLLALSKTETLFGNLTIDPPVFTPNGDGVNDQTVISFILLKVEEKEPKVVMYDPKGGMVKELVRSLGREHRYLWDGRDETNEVVPPGLYICRVSIDAEAGKTVENRTIGVVY